MMTNAELMVLSVGNEKRLDTTQNTADQVVQRKRSARLYSTHARIQMSTTDHEYVYCASKEWVQDFTINVEIIGKPLEIIIDIGRARTLLSKRWFKDNIDSHLKQSNGRISRGRAQLFGNVRGKCET